MSRRPQSPCGKPATPRLTVLAALAALALGLTLASGAPARAQAPAATRAAPPATGPAALAGPAPAALPDTAALARDFQRTPAWQAARLARQAEQSGLRQGQLGPHEWTASASTQRWRQRDAGATTQWQEWEIGVDRTVRLPGKRATAEALGLARVAQAEAALLRAWREHGRQYLQHWGEWQREAAAAAVADALVTLLQHQARAVATRQRLGDAARIEQAQAEAALAQAQAQAAGVAARAAQAQQRLEALFPGLPAQGPGAGESWLSGAPAGVPPATDLQASIDAQLAHSPEWAQARREAAALRALAAQEQAAQRPDPTLGLRLGGSRGGAERMVGVVFSVPIGGAAREAGAAAAALRASAAEHQADELARQLRAQAGQRVQALAAATATLQRQREAAQRLDEVARTLARGFALGEGSLAEVLAARRLAHEQALAAATGAIEQRLAALHLQLEAGQLWAWPPEVDAAP